MGFVVRGWEQQLPKPSGPNAMSARIRLLHSSAAINHTKTHLLCFPQVLGSFPTLPSFPRMALSYLPARDPSQHPDRSCDTGGIRDRARGSRGRGVLGRLAGEGLPERRGGGNGAGGVLRGGRGTRRLDRGGGVHRAGKGRGARFGSHYSGGENRADSKALPWPCTSSEARTMYFIVEVLSSLASLGMKHLVFNQLHQDASG